MSTCATQLHPCVNAGISSDHFMARSIPKSRSGRQNGGHAGSASPTTSRGGLLNAGAATTHQYRVSGCS